MPLTFSEAFQKLEDSRLRRAVWTQVVDFLGRCVATEVKEARDKIVPDGCIAKEVPEELIREILQEIEADKIAPLDTEISTLENLEVVETKKDDDTAKGKRKKATSKKNQKAVRIVPPTARAAGGGADQEG